jgi:hypothetical protein
MRTIKKNQKIRIFSLGIGLAVMISVGIIMQSCNSNDLFAETLNEKPEFPSYADNYGKAVAKEFRNTVESLNKMGVNYSNANNSAAFREKFYEDLCKVNPIMVNNKDVVNSWPQINPTVFAEKIRNLTNIQLKFIQRIIKECDDSKSYQDLSQRLVKINDDIYSEVPEIQQERLFNITAVLYYGINELQKLEKQGQMLSTPQNNAQRVRLKSGEPESGANISGSCRSFLATVWVIAIGEPTPAGEIVAAIVTVGILLYEITVCGSESSSNNNNNNDDDDDYCQSRFVACYSPIYDGCSQCLQFCKQQGYWPPYSTHQCY